MTAPITAAARFFGPLAILLAVLAAPLLGGCATYTIEGRVVRGPYPSIVIVSEDDPAIESAQGLPGVGISVVRDPMRLNRAQVGSTTSGPDGRFELVVSAAGAGLTDEEWLVAAGRSGLARVETMLRLPSGPGRRRLLVTMAPGADGAAPTFETAGDEIRREVDRFWR